MGMLDVIRARLRQGMRTTRFPRGEPPAMTDRFRGLPRVDASLCADGCAACAAACPTGAITAPASAAGRPAGIAAFRRSTSDCASSVPTAPGPAPRGRFPLRGISGSRSRTREGLRLGPTELVLAEALAGKLRRLLGRSLRLRQVSAGGCGACEADANVLTTVGWDIGRFGIGFVASPRHADGLLVTGPVTRNMRLALRKTWEAVPGPRIVIACGACAISGGLYAGKCAAGPRRTSPESCGGVGTFLPVDLFVPGCPPHPLTLLDGLLRLLGRIRTATRPKDTPR